MFIPNYEVLPVRSKKHDQEKEILVMAFLGNMNGVDFYYGRFNFLKRRVFSIYNII